MIRYVAHHHLRDRPERHPAAGGAENQDVVERQRLALTAMHKPASLYLR